MLKTGEVPVLVSKNRLEISVVLYQEDGVWIAQAFEYDITAQAPSLTALAKRFTVKLVAECVISIDLGLEPLEGIDPAPQKFWQMYEQSDVIVDARPSPVRIGDGIPHPAFLPHMRVAENLAAWPLAVPFGHEGFTKVKDLLEHLQNCGCEVRVVDGTVTTPWGEFTVRYVYNPETKGRYDISDLEDDQYVGRSIIASMSRRLKMNIDLS